MCVCVFVTLCVCVCVSLEVCYTAGRVSRYACSKQQFICRLCAHFGQSVQSRSCYSHAGGAEQYNVTGSQCTIATGFRKPLECQSEIFASFLIDAAVAVKEPRSGHLPSLPHSILVD